MGAVAPRAEPPRAPAARPRRRQGGAAYTWEPVIYRTARKWDREQPTARDHVSCSITLQRGLTGAKPDAFCFWLFELLGASRDDEFRDVFCGSGAVSRAWDKWSRQGVLVPSAVDAEWDIDDSHDDPGVYHMMIDGIATTLEDDGREGYGRPARIKCPCGWTIDHEYRNAYRMDWDAVRFHVVLCPFARPEQEARP